MACVVSKEIQFGLLSAQDVVKLSEFQVTHRDLYTPVDRVPVKDGVLDRRLVCILYLLKLPRRIIRAE